MKPEDFVRIDREEYKKTCKMIRREKGKCIKCNCLDCPFDTNNSTKSNDCSVKYANGSCNFYDVDKRLEKSAKKFLKMLKEAKK